MDELTSQEEQPVATRERLFTATFVAIVGVSLCAYITGQGLNAGTSVYIDLLGGTATLAGIGAAVFSGAAIVGRLLSGPLADSRGRLVVIAAGAVVLLAGVLGAALSADLSLMMLWRTLQGIGFSAVTTATATAAADVLPVERLGEGIGYFGLGQALAMSVGPAIAIALVSSGTPENLFWGLAVAAALSLVLCVFCGYERHPQRLPETATYRTRLQEREQQAACTEDANQQAEKVPFWNKIVEPGALVGGLPMMVLSPAFGFGIFFVGLLGTQLGIGNAGIFYTASAVVMIVVRLSSGAFMDRVLPLKLFALAVLAGLVCFALLFVCVALPGFEGLPRDVVFYSAGIFYGLCLGIALPVNQAVAVKNSPAERWGAANGLFMLLFDVGIGIASAAWGFTNDHLGFGFSIGCVMVLAVLSFIVAALVYPASAKRKS